MSKKRQESSLRAIGKLERTQKKQYAGVVARFIGVITTRRFVGYGIYPAGMHRYIGMALQHTADLQTKYHWDL